MDILKPVISSIPRQPDYAMIFAETLWDKAEDQFDAAVDSSWDGLPEWAGFHACLGWHFLQMRLQYIADSVISIKRIDE